MGLGDDLPDLPALRRPLRLLTTTHPQTVAIVGSRFGVDQTKVEAFCASLFEKYPQTVVISGGAKGTDTFAEQAWRKLGGEVVSLRVKEHPHGGFGVMRYELRDHPLSTVYDLTLQGHPTWEEAEGALFYRSMLVADEAEVAAVFWNGKSAGTRWTMDFFKGRKKPVYMIAG